MRAECLCPKDDCSDEEIEQIMHDLGGLCCHPDFVSGDLGYSCDGMDTLTFDEWQGGMQGGGGDCAPFVGTCDPGSGPPDHPDCMLSCDEFLPPFQHDLTTCQQIEDNFNAPGACDGCSCNGLAASAASWRIPIA